jgi:hypothetical protein
MMKKLIAAIDKVILVLDVESDKPATIYDRFRNRMYE